MTTIEDEPWDFHIVRVEVTVAAVIQEPNGDILGRNMCEATLAFGWRTNPPAKGVSDAQVNAALAKALSPVLALIDTNLSFNGWVAMGEVDDPMIKAGAAVVGHTRSDPVTVQVHTADERNAVHD